MRVLRKEKTSLLRPWREVVVLEADDYESTRFGHLLGTKKFWVNEGSRVRMSVPKSWCSEVGDQIDLDDLVVEGQTKFSWKWV